MNRSHALYAVKDILSKVRQRMGVVNLETDARSGQRSTNFRKHLRRRN